VALGHYLSRTVGREDPGAAKNDCQAFWEVISALRDVPSKPLLPIANLQNVMGQF